MGTTSRKPSATSRCPRVVAALLAGGTVLAPGGAAAQAPSSPRVRLETAWISLEPQVPPPNRPDAPPEEGWPDAGSRVHWVAHVVNRASAAALAVPYAWHIDDRRVAEGLVDLPPGESTVWLPWSWTFERHAVAFELSPAAELGDATRNDDALAILSDALTIGFRVEQSLYDWMAEGGRPGFERWAQGQIDRWNGILERTVYPSTPAGVLDRLRLDSVVVVPDGTERGRGELASDLTFWFFEVAHDLRFLHVGCPPAVLADQTIVLHELLHQRGLTDLYAYEVHHGDRTGSRVEIREGDRLVAGSFLMPFLPLRESVVYRLPADGLMGTRIRAGTRLTEHSAFGLNLRAGRRTPRWLDEWGNVVSGFTSQYQLDSYLERRPERTRLRLVDPDGRPLAGAEVGLFLDHSQHFYQDIYAAEPDRVHRADADGAVVLSGDEVVPARGPQVVPASLVIILRVRTAAARAYAFLPVYDLNLLAFRGADGDAEIEIEVKLHPF